MTTAATRFAPTTPAPTCPSHLSELLEVAAAILQRHRDEDLAKKVFVIRGYLELSKLHPERDYREKIDKALADLSGAVHLHLNAELHIVATLLARLGITLKRPTMLI